MANEVAVNLKDLVGLDRTVMVPSAWSERVPQRKPGYVMPTLMAGEIVRWWFAPRRVQSLMLLGPSGCGKTSCIIELCAALNWPLYSVRVNPSLRPEDLEGSPTLISNGDGSSRTEFVPGNAVRAYRDGGVLLLDEGNRAHPSVHSWLNAMVEGYPITIMQTGEVVQAHENFRAILTGNAGFQGDETGSYVDSQAFCVSFASRFRTLHFGYPTEQQEVSIVRGVAPKIPLNVAKEMVVLGRKLRDGGANNSGGALSMLFQVRHLEAWASAVQDEYSDVPVVQPLFAIYCNAFGGTDRNAATSLIHAAKTPVLGQSLDSLIEQDRLERERRAAERAVAAAAHKAAMAGVAAGNNGQTTGGEDSEESVAPEESDNGNGSPAQGTRALGRGEIRVAPADLSADIDAYDEWTILHCANGSHDKVYAVFNKPVVLASGGYGRLSFYGPRDGTLKPACKAFASMHRAMGDIRVVLDEKQSRSHKDGGYLPADFNVARAVHAGAVAALRSMAFSLQ